MAGLNALPVTWFCANAAELIEISNGATSAARLWSCIDPSLPRVDVARAIRLRPFSGSVVLGWRCAGAVGKNDESGSQRGSAR